MEGKKAYLDHEKASEIKDRNSRSVKDVAGWYEGVRQDSDGSVRATLNLVETPHTEHVLKIAKANPDLVGLSINAKGKASRGKIDEQMAMIAETVDKVYSTDIVTEAAAGGEMEAMRLVASVPMDIDDVEDDMADEIKIKEAEMDDMKKTAEWLIAEANHRSSMEVLRAWLEAEDSYKAAEERKIIESKMEEVPEDWKGFAGTLDKDALVKFVETVKNAPAVKKDDTPAGGEEKKPGPGEEGYKRHFF